MQKIAIVGTRGIPACYGGFETFAEEVSTRLASQGMDITVWCDCSDSQVSHFGNVALAFSSYKKSKNPLKYYYDSINRASKESDILLVAGTGGAIFYWLAKLRGKKIVTNIDGIESKRAKWSFLKKLYIKLSEILSIRYSDVIIADSEGIKRYVLSNYRIVEERIRVIEYGALVNYDFDQAVLEKYGLVSDSYYLVVSRLEPENNIQMIVEGYLLSKSDKPLVIVGGLNSTAFVNSLLRYQSENVRFLDGIYNKHELSVIRASCFAYLHGHSVGGTNPSLLEAMGSGNISVCHDNVFNREVTNSLMFYFSSASELSNNLLKIESLSGEDKAEIWVSARLRITDYYNWGNMTEKYFSLLNEFNCTR